MYAYINGEVVHKGINQIIVDVGGVGYEIFTDTYTLNSLNTGEKHKVYTYLKTSDDGTSLYGFQTLEQKSMFLKLIAISGVGPKAAMAVLSALKVNDIAAAVISGDDKAFLSANGIGKKTAQRLVLELKEKVDFDDAVGISADFSTTATDAASEAVAALLGLGYTRQEALNAVSAVKSLGDTAEELVGLALRKMV